MPRDEHKASWTRLRQRRTAASARRLPPAACCLPPAASAGAADAIPPAARFDTPQARRLPSAPPAPCTCASSTTLKTSSSRSSLLERPLDFRGSLRRRSSAAAAANQMSQSHVAAQTACLLLLLAAGTAAVALPAPWRQLLHGGNSRGANTPQLDVEAAAAAGDTDGCGIGSGTDPEGLRLSLGDADDEIVVMWSTRLPTRQSCVQYQREPLLRPQLQRRRRRHGAWRVGPHSSGGSDSSGSAAARRLQMDPVGAETLGGSTACGSSFPFVEPGSGAVSQHVHKVVLRSLVPGERYRYRCGSAASGGGDGCGWSAWRSFTAKRRHLSSSSGGGSGSQQHSAQLLVVGDMGALNARCLPDLVGEVQGSGGIGGEGGGYDALLHVGDLAYDLQVGLEISSMGAWWGGSWWGGTCRVLGGWASGWSMPDMSCRPLEQTRHRATPRHAGLGGPASLAVPARRGAPGGGAALLGGARQPRGAWQLQPLPVAVVYAGPRRPPEPVLLSGLGAPAPRGIQHRYVGACVCGGVWRGGVGERAAGCSGGCVCQRPSRSPTAHPAQPPPHPALLLLLLLLLLPLTPPQRSCSGPSSTARPTPPPCTAGCSATCGLRRRQPSAGAPLGSWWRGTARCTAYMLQPLPIPRTAAAATAGAVARPRPPGGGTTPTPTPTPALQRGARGVAARHPLRLPAQQPAGLPPAAPRRRRADLPL